MERLKKNIKLLGVSAIGISIIAGFILCFSNHCSFCRNDYRTKLTEFTITNPALDSVTNEVTRNIYPKEKRNKSIVLSFEEENDTLNFIYALFDSLDDLSYHYVFIRNYRVIGYVDKGDYEMFVMSNINNYTDMIMKVESFIKPSEKYKDFNCIFHETINQSNWDSGSLSDKIRYHFKYYDGKIYGPIGIMD